MKSRLLQTLNLRGVNRAGVFVATRRRTKEANNRIRYEK